MNIEYYCEKVKKKFEQNKFDYWNIFYFIVVAGN
jgi:hypothetical protein